MDLYEVIKARRSIRKYKSDPVARDVVERIIDAARLAPSWCNRQCHRYIIISDKAKREALGELLDNPSSECYRTAPYTIVLCADSSDSGYSCGKEYYLVDCGISMEHLVLAATAEGLGTCWVGSFRENSVRNLLGISRDVSVVAITPLGYPDEAPEPRERYSLKQIICDEGWSKS